MKSQTDWKTGKLQQILENTAAIFYWRILEILYEWIDNGILLQKVEQYKTSSATVFQNCNSQYVAKYLIISGTICPRDMRKNAWH